MKIHNQNYSLIFKQTIAELTAAQPRLARLLATHGIKARLYVENEAGQFFVVDQYQSGSFGKVTAA